MNRSKSLRGALPIAALAALILAGEATAESLQQAWDTALQVDRGLKAAREHTATAAELVEAAKSSRMPSVALGAGYTALDNAPAFKADVLGQSLQMSMAQRNSASFSAMATLPIYTAGRIGRGIDAAFAALDAARQGEIGDAQDLKLRVAETYVGVLRAGRMRKVAESHVLSLEAHARDVGNLHQQGMVAKSDLLSAQVALADARQKALQAANAVDLSQAAYNRLMARPLDQAVQLDELAPAGHDQSLAELTARAKSQRSELTALARQIEALRHQAGAVRGENGPQIALSGGYGYQENRYQVHEGQWMVTLGAKWNIFDGGVVNHRAAAIERQSAALTEQREELLSIVALQARQAWLDVEETRKRVQVTQAAIAQAEENLRMVRDRYANGLSTHTEVLDAESLRVNSEANHAGARFDAVLAELRLKRAAGEL